MSLKSAIVSRVTQYVTGEQSLERRRRQAEKARQKEGRVHQIEYFHAASDPYSHLMAQVLALLLERYDVELKPYLAPAPPDWAAPERERLETYSRQDAVRLAAKAGLQFEDPGHQPPPERLQAAEAALASILDGPEFGRRAASIGAALWSGGYLPDAATAPSARLAEGAKRRGEQGHYLGAMLHYEGEWYWGLDRLHYLEQRLRDLGVHRAGAPDALIFPPPAAASGDKPQAPASEQNALHWYLSFRSPYTYIVAERARALAQTYGAELRLCFVLPMVMRGLPVPRMKGMYIARDVAREARRLGIPYGRIADPVGKPVERGYAILPFAREQGLGFEYCHSFLKGVWAEGIDAGSDQGLRRIVERAGLDWAIARDFIGGDHWRAEAEANRAEMMQLGLWGVPSFRVGNVATWGQDRLWVVEEALCGQSGVSGP